MTVLLWLKFCEHCLTTELEHCCLTHYVVFQLIIELKASK